MTHSDSLKELGTALAKAQSQIEGAKKDSDNPFFKSKYADLASVWDACRKQLTDNGLSVVQMPFVSADGLGVTTMLLHASGEWIESSVAAHGKDASPQSVGSAITYLRRYALAAMAGVPQIDDDAESAEGRKPSVARVQSKPAAPEPAAQQDAPDLGPDLDLGPDTHPNFPGASVKVTGIKWAKSKPDAPKPWSAAFVTFSDGKEAATFSSDVQQTLNEAHKSDSWVFVSTEPNPKDPKKRNIIGAILAKDVAG